MTPLRLLSLLLLLLGLAAGPITAGMPGPLGDSTVDTIVGSLSFLGSVAVDRDGTLYYGDENGDNQEALKKITLSGVVSDLTTQTFSKELSLVLDGEGSLYFTDPREGNIWKVSTSSGATQLVTATTAGGLALREGNLYYTKTDGTVTERNLTSGAETQYASGAGTSGLAFDAAGNLYVADFSGAKITKVAASGQSVTDFDTGVTDVGPVAVDGEGNVYAGTSGQILRYTPAGIASTVVGGGSDTTDGAPSNLRVSGFVFGIALDPLGRLYWAASALKRLTPADTSASPNSPVVSAGTDQLVSRGTTVVLEASATDPDGDPLTYRWMRTGRVAPSVELSDETAARPTFLATVGGEYEFTLAVSDGQGERVTDTVNVTVKGIPGPRGDGTLETLATGIDHLGGMALDHDGTIYYGIEGQVQPIRKRSPDGTTADVTATSFDSVTGLALDGAGFLYVAVQAQSVSGAGKVSRVRLADGAVADLETGLDSPWGIAVRDGSVYFSQGDSVLVRLDLGTGTTSTFASSAGHRGLAFDPEGNLYVGAGPFVRKVEAGTGTVSVFAGSGTGGGSVDGTLATSANLESVFSVAADGHGNVYVDSSGRLYRIDSSGILTSVAGNGVESSDGSPSSTRVFNNAFGLAVDASGRLLFAESNGPSGRLGRITPAGAAAPDFVGANWVQLSPSASPPELESHAMASGAVTGTVLLFQTQSDTRPTWRFDGVTWEQLDPPGSTPPRRSLSAMVLDTDRARVLMFGGGGASTNLNDTWEWDGTEWTAKSPATAPSRRARFAMAYDSARSRVVLYGGSETSPDPDNVLADTWEYDPSAVSWSQLSPATSPGPLHYHAMAYDAAREKVVLYGGRSDVSAAVVVDDTWEWDGTDWTQVTASGPPNTANTAMVYDARRRRVIAYGGTSLANNSRPFTDETWEWDGATWTRLAASTSPPARQSSKMAWDAVRQVPLLFGGNLNSPVADASDTWQLLVNSAPTVSAGADQAVTTGTPVVLSATASDPESDPLTYSWVRTGGTGPAVSLSGADSASASFTPATSGTYTFRVTVSDGRGGVVTDDVTVTAREPLSSFLSIDSVTTTHAAVVQGEPGLSVAMLVTNSSTGPVSLVDARLVFLGAGATVQSTEYAASPWSSNPTILASGAQSQLQFTVGVLRRATTGTVSIDATLAVTDPASGESATVTGAVTTASWLVVEKPVPAPGRSVRWTELTADGALGSPPRRSDHALAFDSARGRSVLFGGLASGIGRANDTWEWDGVTWSEVTAHGAVGSPPARSEHALAYDGSRGRVVLFGGHDGSQFRNDTWEWDGTSWSQRTANGASGSPVGRIRHAMAYDVARSRVVLVGGADGTSERNDTWEWDGTAWSELTEDGAPGFPQRREAHSMTFHGARGRVVLFGGYRSGTRSNDLWEWDGTSWTQLTSDGAVGSPPRRYGPRLADDPSRGRVVLFGGQTPSLLNDSWEWDGVAWSQVTTDGETGSPRRRYSHDLASDTARDRVVLFGGYDGSGNLNDTWVLEPAPPAATLTYSRPGRDFGQGTFAVTATFDQDITPTAATIGISGGTTSPANDVTGGTAMTQGADRKTWTFSRTVQTGDDGTFTITLGGTNAEGQVVQQPADNSFTIDTLSPAISAISFSRPSAPFTAVSSGPFSITVTYDESLASPPSIAISGGSIGTNDISTTAMPGTTGATWTFAYSIGIQPGDDAVQLVSIFGGEDLAGNVAASALSSFVVDTLPPSVSLSYSKPQTAVSTGPLVITATFDEALLVTPSMAIDRPGTGDDLVATTMTATGDPAIWTLTHTIADRNGTTILDGSATVAVTGGKDAAGNDNQTATNAAFTVLTTGAPTANAGTDRAVNVGTAVTLSGTGSDPDGDPLTYSWTQTEGPAVTLSGSATATPQFTPAVAGTYRFTLTVNDGTTSATASVTITAEQAFSVAGSVPGTWSWVRRDGPVPSSRYKFSLAYDSRRARTILFGGLEGSTHLQDTWEWDGTGWQQMTPASSPAARRQSVLVYDPVRQRTLLFGGVDFGTTYGDTWEWDGTSWEQRSPATSPPGRGGAGSAYDSARKRIVVFGGAAGGTERSDTWEWDGTSWQQVSTPTAPSPRYEMQMAYDASRQRSVLFSGRTSGSPNDTWEFTGSQWIQRTPATSPPFTGLAAMTYDPYRERVILFGGAQTETNQSYGDHWEWDGTVWTRSSPATPPTSRQGFGMTFDLARNRIVLFGGALDFGNPPTTANDTWEFDGTAWLEKGPSGSPLRRYGHMMAYDAVRENVVLFGGDPSFPTSALSDTWVWDGTIWTQRSPATSPPALVRGGIAYDSGRQKVVLFAGNTNSVGLSDETWEWDGTGWDLASPTSRPPQINEIALAYDPIAQSVLFFGGVLDQFNASCTPDDFTWQWDGTSWTRSAPATKPTRRYDNSLAYDAARGKTVLFGGAFCNDPHYDETWLWDGTNWTLASPATKPIGRRSAAMVYDSHRQRTVLFGGNSRTSDFGDTWAWDGSEWSELRPATSPSARTLIQEGAAYDAARKEVVLFGGAPAAVTTVESDTWTLSSNLPPSVSATVTPTEPLTAQLVTLTAAFSDPDGDTPTYRWLQTFGPPVSITGVSSATATFSATAAGAYGFELVADDGNGAQAFALGTVDVTADALGRALYIGEDPEIVERLESAGYSPVVTRSSLTALQDSTSPMPVIVVTELGSSGDAATLEALNSQGVAILLRGGAPFFFHGTTQPAWFGGGSYTNAFFCAGETTSAAANLLPDLAAGVTLANVGNGAASLSGGSRESLADFTCSASMMARYDAGGTAGRVAFSALPNPQERVGEDGPRLEIAMMRWMGEMRRLGPLPSLTFSKSSRVYGSETFTVTATFDQDITPTVATIGITGGTTSTANDASSGTTMTQGADRKTWTYARTVQTGDDGTFTITLGGTNAEGQAVQQPEVRTFTVDTVGPAATGFSYSRPSAPFTAVSSGPLSITVTYDESLASPPSIAISGGSIGTNDVSTTAMSGTTGTTWTLDYPLGIRAGDDAVQLVSIFGGEDLAGNAAASAFSTFVVDTVGAAVSLSYSKPQTAVSTGPLTITATFGEPLVVAPALAIDRPGSGDDLVATTMTATADPAVWTLAHTVADRNGTTILDGTAAVAVTGGKDAAANENQPATNATFTLVTAGAPAASAGADRTVNAGSTVTLAGTGSDPDDDPLTYSWSRSGGTGPAVSLDGASTPNARFTPAATGAYVFQLTVSDGTSTATDTVTITAEPAFSVSGSMPSTWSWMRRDGALPSARVEHSFTHDLERGRVLLFGGNDGSQYVNDTWTWDGTSWAQETTSTSPPARARAALAFDAQRRRALLFGGDQVTGPDLGDTWEWGPDGWTELGPATAPSPRQAPAMCYDTHRSRIVLFGGKTSNVTSETWEWDGTSWSQVVPATAPPARWFHSLAYDQARRRVVLFGGDDDAQSLDDTWEWDGSLWVKRSPATSPSRRRFHSLAYDVRREMVVLFGGDTGSFASDTWTWDGTDWTQQVPSTSPPTRRGHSLAFEPVRQRVVLFGGHNAGSRHGDTWEYDGTDWSLRATEATTIPTRTGHRMVFDEARGRTVLFGGHTGVEAQDTWEWDGVAWRQRSPSSVPPVRDHFGLAYDPSRLKTVMFGGSQSPGTLNDTWEYDGTDWVQSTAATPPDSSTDSLMVFDTVLGKSLLFGIRDLGGNRDETWTWDGTGWDRLSPSTAPTGRAEATLSYDAARQRAVLFGGYNSSRSSPSQDTWEWDGTTWEVKLPSSTPPALNSAATAYDSRRARTVLFGGDSTGGSGRTSRTFEWDGTDWAEVFPASVPPGRYSHAAAYDTSRSCVVIFGGSGPSGVLSDTWELPSNKPPSVSASVTPSAPAILQQISLSATFSDPDADTPTYRWLQTFGPAVVLTNATSATATFSTTVAASYGFEIVASDGRDGHAYSVGTVEVTSQVSNRPPVAHAGPDRTVTPGMITTLDGRGSSDPDGDALTFWWGQTSGPPVTLSGELFSVASFTPAVTGVHEFALTVSDGRGGTSSATAQVTVVPGKPLPTVSSDAPAFPEGAPTQLEVDAPMTLTLRRSSPGDSSVATALVTSVGFRWRNVTRGSLDVASLFTVTNLSSLPVSLESTELLSLSVTATPFASHVGDTIEVEPVIGAVAADSGLPVSVTTTGTLFTLGGPRAVLRFTALTLEPSVVSAGESFVATAFLRNRGGAAANLATGQADLLFRRPDATSVDSSFQSSSTGAPVLSIGADDSFAFELSASTSRSTTALGTISVGATVLATDSVSGADVSTTSLGLGSVTVQRSASVASSFVLTLFAPGAIERSEVSSGPSSLASTVVELDLTSLAGTSAQVGAFSLVITSGVTDLSSHYFVDPPDPLVLAAGETRTATFSVTAFSTAPRFALSRVSAAATVSDTATGLTTSVTADDAWYVRDDAEHVLGQPDFESAARATSTTGLNTPKSIVRDMAGRLLVADRMNSRVLLYASSSATSASTVLGQTDFVSGLANRGAASPTAVTMSQPYGLAITGSRLIVADTGNHRVLIFDDYPTLSNGAPASVILGQATTGSGLRNRDGGTARPDGLYGPSAVAVHGDTLAIADRDNNRVVVYGGLGVLGSLEDGFAAAARGVFGQDDLSSGLMNRSGSSTPDARTLRWPIGLAFWRDTLAVADGRNHRVLVFDRYSQRSASTTSAPAADKVIGQPGFATAIPGASPTALQTPWGVTVAGNRLLVSDSNNHRVLAFEGFETLPASGGAASELFGQETFADVERNSTPTPARGEGAASGFPSATTRSRPSSFSLSYPAGVFSESSDGSTFWVADSTNSRVLQVRLPGDSARLHAPPSLELVSLQPSRTRVSVGQTFPVTAVVTNSGGASAVLTSGALSMARVAGDGRMPASSWLGSRTVPRAGGTSECSFSLTGEGSSGVYVASSVTFAGRDADTAEDVTLSATSSMTITVEAPPSLTLGAVTMPARVSKGQSFVVEAPVTNAGQATWNRQAFTATFSGSGLSVTADPANPSSLEDEAVGSFRSSVTVAAGAVSGARQLSLDVTGTDANSGAAVSASRANAGSVQVESPARLEVATVSTSSAKVQRGQAGVPVRVTFRNPGEASLRATEAALAFGGGASGYTVTRATSLPVDITGGSSRAVDFTVDVLTSAPLGTAVIDASAQGFDANSGASVGAAAALVTTSWQVETAGRLQLARVGGASRVTRGATARVTVELANAGTGAVSLASVTVGSPASGVTAVLAGTLPGSIGGSGRVTVPFDVSALTSAAAGTARLDVQVVASDSLSGSGLSTSFPSAGGIEVENARPVADAGSDLTATTTRALTLDGTASRDPEGASLTYHWGLQSAPSGSSATTLSLSVNGSGTAARPSFRPDRKGAYRLELAVDDGLERSAPDGVLVTVVNSPPRAAVATPVTSLPIRSKLLLDGRQSSDPDREDSLTYAWAVESVPAGSSVTGGLIRPNGSSEAALTEVVPDLPGVYRLRLDVSDGAGGAASAAVSAVVANTRPVASIAVPASVSRTEPIRLDGSGSGDAETPRDLIYRWRVVSSPAGSAVGTASLAPNGSVTAAVTSFVADRKGDHVIELVVDDGFLKSSAELAVVRVPNSVPVASAPAAVLATVGRSVSLNGSASIDPDSEDALTYRWRLVSRPAASALGPGAPQPTDTAGAAVTSFVPDEAGSYTVELVVTDGAVDSPPVRTTVVAAREIVAPVVLGFTPARVLSTRATTLTVAGAGFTDVDTVVLGDPARTTMTFETLSDSELRAVVPAGVAPGSWSVEARSNSLGSGPSEQRLEIAVPREILVGLGGDGVSGYDAAFDAEPEAAGYQVGVRWVGGEDHDGRGVRLAAERVLELERGATERREQVVTGGEARFGSLNLADGASYDVTIADAASGALLGRVALIRGGPPVARLGLLASSGTGPQVVTLDASGSRALATPLRYRWQVTAPVGATDLDTQEATADYSARRAGRYEVRLTVSDAAGKSAVSTRAFEVANVAPVARVLSPADLVLPHASVPADKTGTELVLDASGSSDANEDPLRYRWRLVSKPETSGVEEARDLAGADEPRATLRIGEGESEGGRKRDAGNYLLSVTVSDPGGLGSIHEVPLRVVDPGTIVPRAEAGTDGRTVKVRVVSRDPMELAPDIPDPLDLLGEARVDFIRLDGRLSSDGNTPPQTLSYAWSVTGLPPGAGPVLLDDPASATPSFRPDAEGEYRFRLVVRNETYASEPSEVGVHVTFEKGRLTAEIHVVGGQRETDDSHSFEEGETVVLRGIGTGLDTRDTLRYVWSVDPPVEPRVSHDPSEFSFVPIGKSEYRVFLTVVDDHTPPRAATDKSPSLQARRFGLDDAGEVFAVPRNGKTGETGSDYPPGNPDEAGESTIGRIGDPFNIGLYWKPSAGAAAAGYSGIGHVNVLSGGAGLLAQSVFRKFERGLPLPETVAAKLGDRAKDELLVLEAFFVPAVPGAYEFEATLIVLDELGRDTGLRKRRRFRIVVSSDANGVPVATVSLMEGKREVLPCQTLALDGSSSHDTGPNAVSRVSYRWKQAAGPPLLVSNPFSPRMTLAVPEFPDDLTRSYAFELYVQDGEVQSEPARVSFSVSPATSRAAELALSGRLGLLSLPVNPSSGGGGPYTVRQLLELTGSRVAVGTSSGPEGRGRFRVYHRDFGNSDAPLGGGKGLLVLGRPAGRTTQPVAGPRWPAATLSRRLLPGLNLVGYPMQPPQGEDIGELAERAGASYVVYIPEEPEPGPPFRIFLPGLTPPFPVEQGQAYLLSVPSSRTLTFPTCR